jgi:hypothetical protein
MYVGDFIIGIGYIQNMHTHGYIIFCKSFYT